jgi:anaerobic nitric oxide reductase flavorubredoxin
VLDNGIFDDTATDLAYYEAEALRYFTNIVAAFSKSVLERHQQICRHAD